MRSVPLLGYSDPIMTLRVYFVAEKDMQMFTCLFASIWIARPNGTVISIVIRIIPGIKTGERAPNI